MMSSIQQFCQDCLVKFVPMGRSPALTERWQEKNTLRLQNPKNGQKRKYAQQSGSSLAMSGVIWSTLEIIWRQAMHCLQSTQITILRSKNSMNSRNTCMRIKPIVWRIALSASASLTCHRLSEERPSHQWNLA